MTKIVAIFLELSFKAGVLQTEEVDWNRRDMAISSFGPKLVILADMLKVLYVKFVADRVRDGRVANNIEPLGDRNLRRDYGGV